jgi:transglutaminase-like putative cysteine protease
MTLAVMVAVLLATFTLTPLTEDGSVFSLSWLLIAVLGIITLGIRRARLGPGTVLAVQLLGLIGFVGLLAATLPAVGLTWGQRLAYLIDSGVEHMQSQAAPMEPNAGVRLIFVTVVGLIWVMTDLLAAGIARPVWSLAPPATLFLVPAVGIGTDTGFLSFASIALGYLVILGAEGLNATARWTRGLARDSADGRGAATAVVWRAAAYIGGAALVLTTVLGAVLPTLSLPGFGFGSGSGGGGPLQLTDPTLDLRRNLTRPADTKIMEYTTDRPGGLYLRTASLPQFNASGWSNIEMNLDEGDRLPQIPGVSGEPAELRTTTITTTEGFRSPSLPLPYAPRSFQAAGEWAYDPTSLVVLSTLRGRDGERATEDLSYTVQSVDITPDAAQLGDAVAGTPSDLEITSAVPDDLPRRLINESIRVTAGADTPAQRAAAIQEYLRSDEFTYSTEQLPGSGYQALENFLFEDKRGYCEQFATTMAMMARVVKIPTRVAIGFLPGERRADGVWEVTAHDMHAWPELYFAGYGWVRFEPTPAAVTGNPPPWTQQDKEAPTDDPSAAPSSVPSAAAPSVSTGPSAGPTDLGSEGAAGSGGTWARSLGVAALALMGLAVLAAPATVRIRRRTVRLAPGHLSPEQVESAWAEIRDTVVDYGGSWPTGSPRVIGGAVAERLEGEEAAAMTRVATMVEQTRYAASAPAEQVTRPLPEMTSSIRRALGAREGLGRRVLAVVLPRSLFRRLP